MGSYNIFDKNNSIWLPAVFRYIFIIGCFSSICKTLPFKAMRTWFPFLPSPFATSSNFMVGKFSGISKD